MMFQKDVYNPTFSDTSQCFNISQSSVQLHFYTCSTVTAMVASLFLPTFLSVKLLPARKTLLRNPLVLFQDRKRVP